jgi:hypothetical protein
VTSRQRTPLEEVLRRCFELPWQDLYEVWRVIGSYIEAGGVRETRIGKQVRERAEALDCLKAAAAHLKLAPDDAPTIEGYKRAREELGLALSARQIELRWEGWQFARLALTGERPVETAAQRSLRRDASGRRWSHEEYLTGVREWLEQKPVSRTRKDYDRWATERNDRTPGPPLVTSGALRVGFALSWEWILRVAEFDVELDDPQGQHLEELTKASGKLKLVGPTGIALLYRTSVANGHELSKQSGFPPPVATLNRMRLWYRKDIEAHRAGRRVRRRQGELQPRIIDSHEASRRLGKTPASLISAIHKGIKKYPTPAGSVSNNLYWMRDEFEAFLAERERREHTEAES